MLGSWSSEHAVSVVASRATTRPIGTPRRRTVTFVITPLVTRLWFAATAVVVLVGLVLQVVATAPLDSG